MNPTPPPGKRAAEFDAADPLAHFAAEFAKPPGRIYLDGNSLGLACRPALATLQTAIDAWRDDAILAWTAGAMPWFDLPRRVSSLLAPLLGADAADLAVGSSTTVNLHQLLATFAPTDVLLDALSFPTDRYAVDGYLRSRGGRLHVVPSDDGLTLDEGRIVAACAGVDFAVLPGVVYTSGQLLDVAGVTRMARERGVRVAWDLSHSAGAVEHHLRDDGVELAFGCSYKYLNGGPGAPAWLYVAPHLRDRLPGLAGWFGCDPAKQFAMEPTFHPAADAGRYLIGTPHVLSLAPLLGALQLIAEATMPALRRKSLALTAYLRERLEALDLRIATPRADHRRGGHLTILHPDAGKLSLALRAAGVVPDFRPPDRLRLAPAALYTSFAECAAAADILADLLTSRRYEGVASDAAVT